MWPTERASRQGLIHFAFGALLLPAGVLMLQHAGMTYLDRARSLPQFLAALALLVLFGLTAFRIARRREYPWLLALAAVALPFFDPTQAPYHGGFRILLGARDLVLIGATILFIGQSIRRADELDRRIHLEAVGWSYSAVLVILLIQAMAADVLPPLRATWVASGLLAGWVVAWLVTSLRYQSEESAS
jgi:hypothetical protein